MCDCDAASTMLPYWFSIESTERLRRNRASCACSRTGQTVGLGIVFAGDVRYGEVERPGQFSTNPIQRVQLRAAAGVFSTHLLHDHFGIRKHVQRLGAESQGAVQRFQKRNILGDIVILVPDPLLDSDGAIFATINHHSNTRGTRIPQRAAIHVGNKIRHPNNVCWNNNARRVTRSQEIELVSLHAVAATLRIAPVLHNNVHRYLRSRRELR